jgi:hypothetical protein
MNDAMHEVYVGNNLPYLSSKAFLMPCGGCAPPVQMPTQFAQEISSVVKMSCTVLNISLHVQTEHKSFLFVYCETEPEEYK